MSLIQEALRMRQTEAGQALKPAVSQPPPIPPQPKPKGGRGLIILLLVLLLALVGYGGWWFFHGPAKPIAGKQADGKPLPPAAGTHQPAPAARAQPLTNLIAQAEAKLETTPPAERREVVKGQTNAVAAALPAVAAPAPAPAASAQQAATKAPPLAAPASSKAVTNSSLPPQAASSNALPARVSWPKLNITGVMGRSGGSAIIFINGQILKAGDAIAGVHILTVMDNGALLVFQGETNFVHVGHGGE